MARKQAVRKINSPYILTCPSCGQRVGVLAASVTGTCTCRNGKALSTHRMKLTQQGPNGSCTPNGNGVD